MATVSVSVVQAVNGLVAASARRVLAPGVGREVLAGVGGRRSVPVGRRQSGGREGLVVVQQGPGQAGEDHHHRCTHFAPASPFHLRRQCWLPLVEAFILK